MLLAFIGFISPAMAQKVAVKTNLLYDATSTTILEQNLGYHPNGPLTSLPITILGPILIIRNGNIG